MNYPRIGIGRWYKPESIYRDVIIDFHEDLVFTSLSEPLGQTMKIIFQNYTAEEAIIKSASCNKTIYMKYNLTLDSHLSEKKHGMSIRDNLYTYWGDLHESPWQVCLIRD